MSRASLPGIPGTASSSSRLASRNRSGEPKWLEQRPLADRPDAAQAVEDRARHRLVAAPAVEVEGEAVRLVADPLQQPRGLRVGGDRQRVASGRARRPPRAAWRARSTVVPRSISGASACTPAESWPLPPSIMIRLGRRGEALVELGVVRGALAVGPEARRGAGESTSSIEAKSSGPVADARGC